MALLYVGLTPLENLSGPFGSPLQISGLLFLALWALNTARKSHRFHLPFRVVTPMLLLCLWAILQVKWTWSQTETTKAAISYITLSLSVIAIADVFHARFRLPLIALSLGATSGAAYLIVAGVQASNGQTSFADVDENILAFSTTLGLAAIIYLGLTTTKFLPRLTLIAMFATCSAATLLIGSRTGLTALIALLMFAFVLGLANVKRATTALVIIVGSFFLFNELLRINVIPPRLLEFAEAPVVVDQRQQIIDAFWYFRGYWQWFGVGAGADSDFLLQVDGTFLNAHSGFWRVWIESGVVGLVLWTSLLVEVVRGAYRRNEVGFFILAALPIGLFMYTLGPIYSNMLWVVFGLALSGFDRFGTPQPRTGASALVK